MEVVLEVDVAGELSKKTTILLSEDLHARLTALGEQEGLSLGELVRRACERQYGLVSPAERMAAVAALGNLALPVGTVATMKQESIPRPEDLLP